MQHTFVSRDITQRVTSVLLRNSGNGGRASNRGDHPGPLPTSRRIRLDHQLVLLCKRHPDLEHRAGTIPGVDHESTENRTEFTCRELEAVRSSAKTFPSECAVFGDHDDFRKTIRSMNLQSRIHSRRPASADIAGIYGQPPIQLSCDKELPLVVHDVIVWRRLKVSELAQWLARSPRNGAGGQQQYRHHGTSDRHGRVRDTSEHLPIRIDERPWPAVTDGR
jgi:hypothetical protein